MTQVLVKKNDGSWALWSNGRWTPTAPPVLSPPEDSAAKASADPLDALVQAVLREVQLPRASPEARRRLETVVRLALKGVRNFIETQEMLVRPENAGGLALAPEVASRVVDIVAKYFAPAHQPIVGVTSTEVPSRQSSTPAPALNMPLRSWPQPTPPVPPPIPPTTPLSRPSMVDVRSTPIALGPLDEFKLMTLTEFRRLSPDTATAAKRLQEKFSIIRDESYDTLMQSLRAWRSSPLYQSYLNVGAMALSAGVTVKQLLARPTQSAMLSEGEFMAMLELGRQLQV